MPYSRLKRLIDMVHSHGSYVSTGGFIERVIASSGGDTKVIGKYLEQCKAAGYVQFLQPSCSISDSQLSLYSFDVLEISSGFLSIPTDDWAELVKLTKSIGLKPKPEIGILFGAGGDTEGLETKGTRDPRWVIERAEKFLAAGADKIMVRSKIP